MADQKSDPADSGQPLEAQFKQPQTHKKTRKSPKKPKRRPLPPWKVILHNDDVNEFEKVIVRVEELTPLNEQEAVLRVTEANNTGAAILLSTHQERAELYVEQFASVGLTVTAEADS